MNLTPVHNEPALLIEDTSTLVVADLHIGIEFELFTAGARIPSNTREMKERLLKIVSDTGAEKLVILGDLKHNVPKTSFGEAREIPMLMEELLDVVEEVHITPGNHDGGIGRLLPSDVVLHSSKGFVMGDVGLWHGHTWPSEEVMASGTVITAHVHPAVLFVDGVGARSSVRCWLRGKWDQDTVKERYQKVGKGFVMLPAFNELCGGGNVNEEGRRRIGIVMRNGLARMKDAGIYLLDGSYLGTVGDNRVQRSK